MRPRDRIRAALTRLAACLLLAAHAGAESIESAPFVITLSPMNEELAEQTAEVLRDGLRQFEARLPAGDEPSPVLT